MTGPFSILAENIYKLCKDSFKVSSLLEFTTVHARLSTNSDTLSAIHGVVFDTFRLDALSSCHLQRSRLDDAIRD